MINFNLSGGILVINSSLPPDIMDLCNPLQHQVMFCDSKDVGRISHVLPTFLQVFREKNLSVCNEIHRKRNCFLGLGFLGFSFFENREAVALLLLLCVTKQQSDLALAMSAGDVGVRDLHPSTVGAMSSASGAILVHRTGWEIFAVNMLFVSGLPRLAVTSEVLNERKASLHEGAPSGV